MLHLIFSHDLKNGLFFAKSELEYDLDYNKDNDTVTLNLYEPDNWLVCYSYNDRESAEEDLKAVTEEYGIEFREYSEESFVDAAYRIMQRK